MADEVQSTAALKGVTVLDLTQFEAGTVCTEALAWLGADVIKVERPNGGEQGRAASADRPGLDSYYFLMLNANKRSITLDLKHPEGKDIFYAMLKKADVLIENFAPGVIDRLGLDYETVKGINPSIVYAQVKGFGSGGPYSDFLAFDPIALASGGIMSVTGEPDGPPMRPGPTLGDTGTALHACIGILAALYQQTVTGVGQRVEVTMQDAMINFLRVSYARQLMTGKAATRFGNNFALGVTAPSNIYPCKPGGPNDYCAIHVSRAPTGQGQWHRLLEVIGREDLKQESRFESPDARFQHREEVDEIISEWSRTVTKHDAMEVLGRAGVPAGAVFDTMELSTDPYLNVRGIFVTVEHPHRGQVTMPGWPVKLSESSVEAVAAPLLGQDNSAIYGELLGLSEGDIERLKSRGVI